jgi:hypothetical protein
MQKLTIDYCQLTIYGNRFALSFNYFIRLSGKSKFHLMNSLWERLYSREVNHRGWKAAPTINTEKDFDQ